MWIRGPSREENSRRLHCFDKHPACSLKFEIAGPVSRAKKRIQGMPCGYSIFVFQKTRNQCQTSKYQKAVKN